MQQPERTLRLDNIERIKSDFCRELAAIGTSIEGKTGLPLLLSLKRERLGIGPYPHVTLFEAANRIMSDLVILHGVARLLKDPRFRFDEYKVEFGNEDRNGFDIRATSRTESLVGEAFNVARSFFQGKKRTALKKLRTHGSQATYRIIMFNADAAPAGYASRDPDIQHVPVDIPVDDLS
jgi:hypothetical protein